MPLATLIYHAAACSSGVNHSRGVLYIFRFVAAPSFTTAAAAFQKHLDEKSVCLMNGSLMEFADKCGDWGPSSVLHWKYWSHCYPPGFFFFCSCYFIIFSFYWFTWGTYGTDFCRFVFSAIGGYQRKKVCLVECQNCHVQDKRCLI